MPIYSTTLLPKRPFVPMSGPGRLNLDAAESDVISPGPVETPIIDRQLPTKGLPRGSCFRCLIPCVEREQLYYWRRPARRGWSGLGVTYETGQASMVAPELCNPAWL